MDCLRMLSAVPCRKVSVRTFRTFSISRVNILRVCSLRRRISGNVSPRLLTSSMFRSDSVMTPAIVLVSRLMDRWVVLIFLLSSPVSDPRTRMPMMKTGTSSQFLVTEYQIRNPIPTIDENRMLMNELTNCCVSIRTFCRTDSVSPLRCSSNSWKDSRRVCLRPSLKICMPNFWTASRVRYSWKDLAIRANRATVIATPSHHKTPFTNSCSGRMPGRVA